MKEFDPNPLVFVAKNAKQVVIQRCPFCKKKHYHGPSGLAGERGPDGGHRVAHCRKEDLPDALRGITLGYHLRFRGEFYPWNVGEKRSENPPWPFYETSGRPLGELSVDH